MTPDLNPRPSTPGGPADRPPFAFGRNWARFTRFHLDDEVLKIAERSLVEFLDAPDLAGRSFLDVGCGSGLFSLAALRLRASHIVSFDVDPDSVSCCRELRRRAGDPPHWQVLEGSILDVPFVRALAPADIVYSWGVLHHTGRMWDAVAAAASRIAPGGVFYLALYNRAEGWRFHDDGSFGPSTFWTWEKRLYNALPAPLQRGVEGVFAAIWGGLTVLRAKNPYREIREHRLRTRGMSWIVDLRDWLGGYPYEFASADEVQAFCEGRLGLRLERVVRRSGTRNNEFLFRRAADRIPP